MTAATPTSFGDVEEPTLEQDAAIVLKRALLAIRREHGERVRDCASYAIAALGRNDGLLAKDLGDSIAEDLELDVEFDGPTLADAVFALERYAVLNYRRDRLYLNPSVTEAVMREVFR